jgi:hypothetical protein
MLLDASVLTSAWRVVLYNLSKSLTVAGIIIVSVGFAMESYLTLDKLEEFAESFGLVITQFKNSVKLISLFLNRKKVLKIIYDVEDNFFIHDKELSAEERSLISRYLRHARRFAFIFWFQWGLCLLSQVTSKRTAEDVGREMPIKMWIPFETKESPYYELGYLYNTLFCVIISWNVAVTDTLFFVLIVHMTAQFELLGMSLRALGKDYRGTGSQGGKPLVV